MNPQIEDIRDIEKGIRIILGILVGFLLGILIGLSLIFFFIAF